MKILCFLKRQSKAFHMLMLMLLAAPMFVSAQSQTVTLFSENFGSYANNDFPVGWTKVITNSTSTVSSSNGHSASRCFKFTKAVQQDNSEFWNIVALPYLEAEAGSMTVSFWSRPGSTNANCGTFDIGYITDLSDASTFVQVSSYDYTEGTTYKQYSVPLENPANAIVAFRHRPLASSTSYQWFIDDLVVTGQLLPCPMTVDLSAELTPMEGDHATLTWTERGTATNWVLQYGTDSEFASGTYTEVNNGFITNGATVTREITGLTSDVTYYARMKSDCGGGDYSAWSNVASFTPSDYLYIGSGTSKATNLPTNLNNQYTLSEQLYTASDLGVSGAGVIYSIGFYNAATEGRTRQCDLYLVNTDKTAFSSTSDWITVSATDKVFSGTITFAANGWTDIVFDTPFDYTGDNIAVIMDDNTGISGGSLSWCLYFTASNYNSLYKAQNGTNLDPSNPNVTASRSKDKNNLRMLYVPGAASSCKRPLVLQASNLGANTATLTWQANGDATAWNVAYKTVEATTWNTLPSAVSGTTCDLTGLTANTDYIARVTANCDDDQWATVTFTTACEAVSTFPWTEDFEDYEGYNNNSGNIAYAFHDPCWINKRVAGSGNYLFQVTTSTQSGNTTQKLVMPSSSMNGTSLELALPVMAFPAGHEYKFILDALRNSSSTSQAEEGVHILASPDGTLENATELGFISRQYNKTPGEFDVPAESASGWYSYEFLLPTNTIRVILKGDYKSNNAFYLDNFKVKEELPCKQPSDPVFVDATSSTATLSWTNGEAGQTAWQVAYKAGANFNPETDLGQYTIADVTSNPGTITGLTPLTTYYAYVRSNCGTLGYSEWSVAYCTFTTECAPVTTFPWTETFESYNAGNFSDPCWVNQHVAGSETAKVFKVNTSTIGSNNTHQLQLPDEMEGNMIKLVLPEMQLATGTDYQFCIDIYRSGNYTGYTSEGIRVYASADGEIEGATEMAFIPRVYSASNAVIPAEATANVWYTYRLAIPLSGSCHIILRGESQWGEATYIDNLKVRVVPSCGEPGSLVAVGTTSSSAIISWTDSEAGQTAWQIAYKDGSDFDPLTDTCTIVDVTSNPATITDLLPQTTYYAYVRSNCGNLGYSEWCTTPCHFTTGCGAVTDYPWSEDFESHSSGNFNDPCFVNEHISGDGTSIFQVYVGTVGTNSTHQLRLPNMSNGTYTKLALPEMQFEAGEDYDFSIDVYRTSQSYYREGIRIFASADGTIENGTEIGFIPRYYSVSGTGVPYENAVGWYTYRFRIPSGVSNIILRGESINGEATYMDNLKVNVAPSCSYPSNLQVPSDDVMARNATVKWTAGDATEWIVEYKTQASTEYTAITGVTETPYVLTGLVPQTQYSVRVRAVCSPTEITEPTNPKTFTTKAPYDVPQRLRASNVSPAGATLTWVARDNEDHWDLFYTDNPDYEPQNYTHPQFANITSNPFQLTGLEPGRTYYIYVRSNEGANGVSGWSAPCRVLLANELTLNDSTVTNSCVPLIGHYANYGHDGWFIIPAEDLQNMLHADIHQLVFYNSASNIANIDWGDVLYSISLGEASVTEHNTQPASSILVGGAVTCFERHHVSVIDHRMTIEFDQPYRYDGGNLYVHFDLDPSGTVNTDYVYWLGVATENTQGFGSSYYYRRYNDYGPQSFLPKVTFSYLYQGDDYCYVPTDLQASNVTTNSATLSWTNIINDNPAWELQYRKSDESEYITVEGTVTNPFTLQGLEPSYGYDVRVRAACGEGLYSDWVETWFATACAPLTSLPYSTGFEDMVYGVLPPCWSYYSNGEYDPGVTHYNAFLGDCSLGLYAPAFGNVNIVVLPEIPVDAQHPMSGNELVFAAASMSYITTTLQVGVMTDPNDPESFDPVAALELPDYSGYQRFKVSFANYTGSGTYIAIRQEDTSPIYSFEHYIDDIVVRPISDCAEPTGLTVSNVTSASATLQWTAGGTEAEWQVQYMPIDIYYYYYYYYSYYCNLEWPETYQTVSQPACTLSGLAEGTSYVARVRAVCSSTETSEWSDVALILTSYTTPFFDDFGTSDQYYSWGMGWCFSRALLDEVLNNTVSLSFGVVFPSTLEWGATSHTFSNDENGMKYYSEIMHAASAYGSEDHYWMISPRIELGEGYQLNFDLALLYNQAATSGLEDNRFTVLVTTDDGTNWTTLGLWDYEGTAGRNYYDIPSCPSEVNIDLSSFNNQTIRIAFYVESTVGNLLNNSNTSTGNTMYIDNVNVTKRVKPDVIVASNVTANSASLNWTTHGETYWTLQYRIDDDLEEWTTVNDITTLPYTLDGLQVARHYQVRVKAHYASSDSEWSFTALFATACDPISLVVGETYEEQFNGVVFPACWDRNGSNTCNWSWYDFGGYEYSEMHAPTSNGSTTLVMPQIEVSQGMSLTFHHSTRTSSHIQIKVRVSNNPVFMNYTSGGYFSDDIWDNHVDDQSAGVTVLSLNEYAGQTVYVGFYAYVNSSNQGGYTYGFSISDVMLSIDNAFVNQTENRYWDETENWTLGVLPGVNENVLIIGDAVIPNGCTVQVDEIYVANGGSLTLADGAQLKHNNEGVTAAVQKSIVPYTITQTNEEDKANGWYLIASPMRNAVEPTGSMFANTIDLYRFNHSVDLEWENYYQCFYLSPYFKLFNGHGYLYANSGDGYDPNVMIEMEGQLRPAGGDVSVHLAYDADASFSGWNLVGNPFACDAYLADGRDFYVLNDDRDEVVINDSGNSVIAPLEGFFVQAADANDDVLIFTATMPQSQGRGGALVLSVYEGSALQSSDELSMQSPVDRTRVRFGDGPTLGKFSLKSNGTKLFITQGHQDYAVVYADKQSEVSVSFKASENGSYTLTVNPENAEMRYLHLIDSLTGADVDLLTEPSYTFDAKTTDDASRFRLVFDGDDEKTQKIVND